MFILWGIYLSTHLWPMYFYQTNIIIRSVHSLYYYLKIIFTKYHSIWKCLVIYVSKKLTILITSSIPKMTCLLFNAYWWLTSSIPSIDCLASPIWSWSINLGSIWDLSWSWIPCQIGKILFNKEKWDLSFESNYLQCT